MVAQTTLDAARKKVAEAQKELEKLERQVEATKKLSPVQQAAMQLHDRFCRFNHADQCGWFYAMDKDTNLPLWTEYSQQEYLKMACGISNAVSAFNADDSYFLNIIEAMCRRY